MILFPSKLFEIITNSGEEFYPTEACGLVIGREEYNSFKTVTQIIKSKNVAHIDPSHHFQIDPQVQFDTIRMLAKQNDISKIKKPILLTRLDCTFLIKMFNIAKIIHSF
jgi:proteasome lid subunit RPN8/RPN11